jgi:hypothetical protein
MLIIYLCTSFAQTHYYVQSSVNSLDAGLLASSQYPEGPALTSHLGKLLLHASHVALRTAG